MPVVPTTAHTWLAPGIRPYHASWLRAEWWHEFEADGRYRPDLDAAVDRY